MEILRSKTVFVSLLLSLIAALLVIFTWEFIFRLTIYISNYLTIEKMALNWWSVLMMLIVALTVGYLSETFSVKRIIKYAVPFVFIWAFLSYIAAACFSVNLFFLRTISVVLLPIFFVHAKKLWLIAVRHLRGSLKRTAFYRTCPLESV